MCTIIQDTVHIHAKDTCSLVFYTNALAFARHLDEIVGHLVVRFTGNVLDSCYRDRLVADSIVFIDGSIWDVDFGEGRVVYWRAPWMPPPFIAAVITIPRMFIHAPDDHARLACCRYNGPRPT